MKLWITDPETGHPSVTRTLYVVGFIVCCLKLLLSGLDIGAVKFGEFSGGDFGMAIGALGAVYVLGKKKNDVSKV